MSTSEQPNEGGHVAVRIEGVDAVDAVRLALRDWLPGMAQSVLDDANLRIGNDTEWNEDDDFATKCQQLATVARIIQRMTLALDQAAANAPEPERPRCLWRFDYDDGNGGDARCALWLGHGGDHDPKLHGYGRFSSGDPGAYVLEAPSPAASGPKEDDHG